MGFFGFRVQGSAIFLPLGTLSVCLGFRVWGSGCWDEYFGILKDAASRNVLRAKPCALKNPESHKMPDGTQDVASGRQEGGLS